MREALTKNALRLLFKPVMRPEVPIGVQRAWVQALTLINLPAPGIDSEYGLFGGVPCEILLPKQAPRRTIVFLHGGAYVLGSPATHRAITSFLAADAQARVIVPDYRLAPEHPWPAALEDAVATFKEVSARFGPTALSGDSAGGGLALSCAQALRDQGAQLPEALLLISPWADMSNSQPSHVERAQREPMLRGDWSRFSMKAFVNGQGAPEDPRWSPLFAEMRGLPPTRIHVGSEEILHDDAVALEAAMRNAGVTASLRVFDGLWHDFHMHARLLPRAREGVQDLAAFLDEAASTA